MSKERHPINQCHYGATVKTLEEKIDWQNRRIAAQSKRIEWHVLDAAKLRNILRGIEWACDVYEGACGSCEPEGLNGMCSQCFGHQHAGHNAGCAIAAALVS